MITKGQLKILEIFKRDLFRSLTFIELKEKLKESSNSKLQRAILNFKAENLINIKQIGKTNLISLNYLNNKLFDYFSILNLESGKKIPLNIVYEIQESILKETEFFSLIVFGSFAEEKATKKSDLDIAVIVESQEVKNRIIPRINSFKRKSLREIDIHVFTREEFVEMLRDEKENLGKEIVKNHFVFYGMINFYKLILKEKNVVIS